MDNITQLEAQSLNKLFGPKLLQSFDLTERAILTQMGDWLRELYDRAGNSSTVLESFVQPAAMGTVTVPSGGLDWAEVGQLLYVAGGGLYQLASKTSSSVTLVNLGYAGNAAPATTVAQSAASPASGGQSSVFSDSVALTPGGPPLWIGDRASDPSSPANVAGRVASSPMSLSRLTVAVGQFAFAPPAPVIRVTTMLSSDGGVTYSPTLLTLDVDLAVQSKKSLILPAFVSFASETVHLVKVEQLSGGGGLAAPVSISVS